MVGPSLSHLDESVGLLLQDGERLGPELLHDLTGRHGTDALHQPARQVALDARLRDTRDSVAPAQGR